MFSQKKKKGKNNTIWQHKQQILRPNEGRINLFDKLAQKDILHIKHPYICKLPSLQKSQHEIKKILLRTLECFRYL